ncbi:TolC family protein [Planktotalea sp.]|uniref:TolC family protein n=1 Tax=Planktotalea sp. TaxID=2029877 RepID=UPI003F6CDF7D
MTANRAKTGLMIAGLAMGLSGCVNTLEQDIPFVSRFSSDDANLAQSEKTEQGFSLFKRNETAASAANSENNETGGTNPFAGLFKKKDAAGGEEVSQNSGGTKFAALFKPKSETAGLSREEKAAQKVQTARAKESAESLIISGLQTRRSLLPNGSAYDQVASSVLAANSRAAESELRAARLRAVAASKNWLPSIGPSISLSSLGDLVANLIVEQVLFDNGRKKAERAYAKADVEVAAVNLSMDTNQRVFTALELYLKAQKAAQKSELSTTAFNDMSHFEYIMSERVRGGVSDRSDLVVLRQKLAEIRSEMASNNEARNTALAELDAMSIRSMQGVRGIPELSVNGLGTKPLGILLAEAEKERAIAEATMERAGNLPGLKATGSTGTSGNSLGLNVTTDSLLSLGTGAKLQAIEAAKEGAQRLVAQAREDSNRRLRALEAQLRGVERQKGESRALTSQSKKNLDLFQAQYKAGTRQVMDVVGVYETYARQQQSAAELTFKSALIKLEIANEMGLLASGAEI